MSVLCVESGITYSDGVAAIAAEGTANRSMRVSGSVSFATSVNPAQYNLGIVIFANPGEETQDDGDINIGAQMTGSFACAAPNSEIRNLRTNNLNLTSAANATTERLITDGLGSDGVLYNDSVNISHHIVHNADDSFISSATRPNSNIRNITSVGANRFGVANGKVNDSVDVNSGNQGYFGEMPGSGNLWEHDGSGTNTITESPVTDIFVDFANGKYGILASSSPGAAGAGAFIQSAPPAGISIDETLSNSGSLSPSPNVFLLSEIITSEALSNSNSDSLSPTIVLLLPVTTDESISNSSSTSLDPAVSTVTNIIVSESLSNSNNGSLNPIILLSSPVDVNESTSGANSESLNPFILISGEVTVEESTSSTNSNSLNPTIEAGDIVRIVSIAVSYKPNNALINYKANNIDVSYGSI